jgi:kynurenine formamidase
MAATNPPSADSYPLDLTDIPYATTTPLNTLSLHLPRPPVPNDTNRLFLIYIHGGAWRDPAILAPSFAATQSHLLHLTKTNPSTHNAISGIATLNYRLSPYPSHPASPSNPFDPARNARHPDHINDVLAAILHLQETYHFGSRYVLIGHSCGATLALQVALKRFWGSQYDPTSALELNVEPPVAVVGVSGIYDVARLVDDRAEISAYRELVVHARGRARGVGAGASPSKGDFGEERWPEGRLVVLVHSEADELVGMEQSEFMWKTFGEQGFGEEKESQRRRKFVKLTGLKHDEVWEDGREFAQIIAQTVDEIVGGEQRN